MKDKKTTLVPVGLAGTLGARRSTLRLGGEVHKFKGGYTPSEMLAQVREREDYRQRPRYYVQPGEDLGQAYRNAAPGSVIVCSGIFTESIKTFNL